jgi:hypothetical protein
MVILFQKLRGSTNVQMIYHICFTIIAFPFIVQITPRWIAFYPKEDSRNKSRYTTSMNADKTCNHGNLIKLLRVLLNLNSADEVDSSR